MATIKITPTLVDQALRNTDWQKLDAQTDEDIARNISKDPDAAPLLSKTEITRITSHDSNDYAAMAADEAREIEAREWTEGLVGDVADEPDDNVPF